MLPALTCHNHAKIAAGAQAPVFEKKQPQIAQMLTDWKASVLICEICGLFLKRFYFSSFQMSASTTTLVVSSLPSTDSFTK
jgi:hypothetical protein